LDLFQRIARPLFDFKKNIVFFEKIAALHKKSEPDRSFPGVGRRKSSQKKGRGGPGLLIF
jgi:hypothetical protein